MTDVLFDDEIKQRLRTFGTHILCIMIDSSFLACWLILQWVLDHYIIQKFIMKGVGTWMLIVFQIIFAISTIIPIILYIAIDLLKMVYRTKEIIYKSDYDNKRVNANNEIKIIFDKLKNPKDKTEKGDADE